MMEASNGAMMDFFLNGWVGCARWWSACWCLEAWKGSKISHQDDHLDECLGIHILHKHTIFLNIFVQATVVTSLK